MDINQLSDREAMGLANYYQENLLENISQYFAKMRGYPIGKLSLLAEDQDQDFGTRYAAAQILALIGDPRINTLQPTMVDIPTSEVIIGIDSNRVDQVLSQYDKVGVLKDWILKETPSFKTNISAFSIRKYLVTNQEYRDFLIETKYPHLPTSWEFGIYPQHKSNHPVYTVTHEGAETFAQWLSHKTGRHFRLPREFEWEYAASGQQHFTYPWGNDYKEGLANTVEEKIYMSTPVGIFPQSNSPFGLADMAGNAEEYVADNYQPYPGANIIQDDLTKKEGNYRIARGGSFTRYADLARTTRRHGRYDKAIYVMGFRLVEIIV